jgi:flagellar protein FliS
MKDKDMYRRSALAQYSDIDVETKASSQDPHQLIQMLFDKACVLLRQASEQLKRGDTESFQTATNHTMQIVLGLRGVLDMEQGGEVAKTLYESYTSISASLFKARNELDGQSVDKLYLALSELREGWASVAKG